MAEPIPTTDVQDLRLWKARWEQAAPVMERLQNEELRRMTPRERLRTLDSLLELGCQFGSPKSVKSWVAFQRKVFERFR